MVKVLIMRGIWHEILYMFDKLSAMNTLILFCLSVILAAGIGAIIYFLTRSKMERRGEFDATRDLFI